MTTYVDESGIENIAVGIVKQARADFIKGAKLLYSKMGTIPTYNELIKHPLHKSLANDADVRWMYDSWRFVHNDPYEMFEVGEDSIIQAWTDAAILEHYKALYLKAGALIYSKHPKDKKIQKMKDEDLKDYLPKSDLCRGFISARKYVSSLPDGDKILEEWNRIAWGRRTEARAMEHKIATGYGFSKANNERFEQRQKNAARAKELYEAGISRQGIAKELGVHIATVNIYLRS